ncbi:MAG: ATP-binding protein, partial [Armatimonadota bacterium]|nr:ATP-binding protein [Armatimonadota bacterium]
MMILLSSLCEASEGGDMAGSTGKTIELTLPSELGNEKLAIALAEAIANRMGFSPDRVADLCTAVGEACINAIEHGNRLDSSVKVLVQLTEQPDSLSVDVMDRSAEPIEAPTGQPCIHR